MKQFNINNLLIAVMLSANSLSVAFGEISGLVVLSVVVLSMLIITINIKELIKKKYKTNWGLTIIFFILLFAETVFFQTEITTMYFLKFISYGVTFMLLPIYNVSFDIILKIIFCIGLLLLPAYLTFDYGYSMSEASREFEPEILMTFSYNMLPFIFASALNIRWKESKLMSIVATIVALTYSILLLVIGSRGALVALVLFIVIQYISAGNNKSHRMKRLFIVVFGTVFTLLSIVVIIDTISDYLSSKGINLLAIARMESQFEVGGDTTSGRSSIYQEAINQFFDAPLLGHGVGGFNDFSGLFPHNMFAQMMVEGGFVFIIPYLFVLFRGCKNMLFLPYSSEYRRFLVFLFSTGLVRLFFSFYLWGSQFFWLALILMINYRGLIRTEISNTSECYQSNIK